MSWPSRRPIRIATAISFPEQEDLMTDTTASTKQAETVNVAEGKSQSALRFESDGAFREHVEASELFPKLKASLNTVEVDGKTYYVAEGDTLLDENELATYTLEREARE